MCVHVFMCVCMYMCARVCICVCSWVRAGVCTLMCMLKPEVAIAFLLLSALFLEAGVPQRTRSLAFWLGCLASELWGPAYLCPMLGLPECVIMDSFSHGCWGHVCQHSFPLNYICPLSPSPVCTLHCAGSPSLLSSSPFNFMAYMCLYVHLSI